MKTSQSKVNLVTKIDEDEDLSSDDEALQILFTIASLLITHYEQVFIRLLFYPRFSFLSFSYPRKIKKFLLRSIRH